MAKLNKTEQLLVDRMNLNSRKMTTPYCVFDGRGSYGTRETNAANKLVKKGYRQESSP